MFTKIHELNSTGTGKCKLYTVNCQVARKFLTHFKALSSYWPKYSNSLTTVTYVASMNRVTTFSTVGTDNSSIFCHEYIL